MDNIRSYRINSRIKRKAITIIIINAVKVIAGTMCFIFSFLILGVAGASDNGAEFHEVIKYLIKYSVMFWINFIIWYLAGGNKE